MRLTVILICGIWEYGWRIPWWKSLLHALSSRLPQARTHVETIALHHPWQQQRIEDLMEQILEKHDSGDPIILVGHSLGGTIACALAPQFVRSRVLGIATIFSPHTLCSGLIVRSIGAPHDPGAPIVSFEALGDRVVVAGARHPRAVRHHVMHTNHRNGLRDDPAIASEIASIIVEELAQSAP